MTITLRSTKGSALTFGELDGNFSDLDARTGVKWQNIVGDITIPSSNGPTSTTYKSVPAIQFDPDAVQEIGVRFKMPNDYVPGTTIYFYINAVAPTADSGVVRFGFGINVANPYDGTTPPASAYQTFVALGTTYGDVTRDATDLDVQRKTLAGGAAIPWLLPGAVLLVRSFRDGTHVNDTYTGPIVLLFVSVAYQCQGFGGATP
jgi:hypothetical protein